MAAIEKLAIGIGENGNNEAGEIYGG